MRLVNEASTTAGRGVASVASRAKGEPRGTLAPRAEQQRGIQSRLQEGASRYRFESAAAKAFSLSKYASCRTIFAPRTSQTWKKTPSVPRSTPLSLALPC
jgi:hypothetical protein